MSNRSKVSTFPFAAALKAWERRNRYTPTPSVLPACHSVCLSPLPNIAFKKYTAGMTNAHNYPNVLLPREWSYRIPSDVMIYRLSSGTSVSSSPKDGHSSSDVYLSSLLGRVVGRTGTLLFDQLLGKVTIVIIYSGENRSFEPIDDQAKTLHLSSGKMALEWIVYSKNRKNTCSPFPPHRFVDVPTTSHQDGQTIKAPNDIFKCPLSLIDQMEKNNDTSLTKNQASSKFQMLEFLSTQLGKENSWETDTKKDTNDAFQGVQLLFLGCRKASNPVSRWIALRSVQSAKLLENYGRVFAYAGKFDATLKRVFHIDRPSDLPVLLLVDELGYIRWSAVGHPTQDAMTIFRECLKKLTRENSTIAV